MWRPRQRHPCASRRMTARARMALPQPPQPSKRDSKATSRWSCMSPRTLQRSIGRNNGERPVNWSVRRGLVGRCRGRLDLSLDISIVFFACNIYLKVANWDISYVHSTALDRQPKSNKLSSLLNFAPLVLWRLVESTLDQ